MQTETAALFPKRSKPSQVFFSKGDECRRPSSRFTFKSRHIFTRATFKPAQEATQKTMTATKMSRAEVDELADAAYDSVQKRVQQMSMDPHNAGRSRDVLLVEAMKQEFARNRQFARQWKKGPGNLYGYGNSDERDEE